jgi:hypothetical protein
MIRQLAGSPQSSREELVKDVGELSKKITGSD